MIAIFCGKLLDGGTATIFGDGKQTRDYVFVDDVVDAEPARRRVGRHRPDQHRPRPGEDRARHRRGAERARRADGFEAEHAPERPGEVQHIALDPSRAREELGWEAQVELDEGLRRTLESLEAI